MTRSIRLVITLVVTLMLTLLATACNGGALAAIPPESQSRTITHAMGTMEIQAVPTRIVALEWTYVEDLLALGVQPVGVADVAGYQKWVNIPVKLDESVTDVGTRQEPSLESIAALEPDLIIGVKFRHEPIFDQLSGIAPTLLFDPYPPEGGITQFEEMQQTLLAIAEAVGRRETGEAVLADMHARFDQAKARLEAGGEFVLAQAFTFNEAPTIRLFTDNSMAVQIFTHIGLENAWEGGFQQYGFSTVGLEALESVQHANFFYVAQADDNPFENQWKDNPAWQGLEFVQEGRVYPLGGDTWLFGGPLSAEVVVDKVVETLAQ
jgi:ferric hydroxamate transport system substrate-binding protein